MSGQLGRLCWSLFSRSTLLWPVLLLSACVSAQDNGSALSVELPLQASVTGVPLIEQQDNYCGPASLAMVLSWSGTPITQKEIASQVFSPGANGSYRTDLISSARRHGQLAVEISTLPALLGEIAAGHPVVVFQNLGLKWLPKWHFAVATGYDLETEQIVLHSGGPEPLTMELSLFERVWRRGDNWALVVLPPDLLPVSVNQLKILQAAASLERTGSLVAAETLYTTGTARWPENWIWPYGLGNTRYQRGDLMGAKEAFESALAIDPSIPEIGHNLAQVLVDLEASVARPE